MRQPLEIKALGNPIFRFEKLGIPNLLAEFRTPPHSTFDELILVIAIAEAHPNLMVRAKEEIAFHNSVPPRITNRFGALDGFRSLMGGRQAWPIPR